MFSSAAAVADVFGDASNAYLMAQKLMGGQTRPATFMVGVKTVDETYTEAVNACIEYNNDWYMIAIESKADADVKEVAAVIQATRKIFAASTASVSVINPAAEDDIGSFLKATTYDRTFLVYHSLAATQFPRGCMDGVGRFRKFRVVILGHSRLAQASPLSVCLPQLLLL